MTTLETTTAAYTPAKVRYNVYIVYALFFGWVGLEVIYFLWKIWVILKYNWNLKNSSKMLNASENRLKSIILALEIDSLN